MNATKRELFLGQIEYTMLTLHGRDRMQQNEAHMYYRTRNSWLYEENMQTWSEMMESNISIFRHIFGITPVMERKFKSDAKLSTAICFPLGLTPKSLY